MRTPILPLVPDKESADAYRKSLHENLFPNEIAWAPISSGVTGTFTAGYFGMGRVWSFSISITSGTSSPGSYIDLPITAYQTTIFNVSVGGLNKPANVNKNTTRLYLPEWTSQEATISGVMVA